MMNLYHLSKEVSSVCFPDSLSLTSLSSQPIHLLLNPDSLSLTGLSIFNWSFPKRYWTAILEINPANKSWERSSGGGYGGKWKLVSGSREKQPVVRQLHYTQINKSSQWQKRRGGALSAPWSDTEGVALPRILSVPGLKNVTGGNRHLKLNVCTGVA